MVSDATNNVVAFARPAEKPPPFVHVEVKLFSNGALQLTAVDEAGDIVMYPFAIAGPVTAADLARLVVAWDGWRDTSTAAS